MSRCTRLRPDGQGGWEQCTGPVTFRAYHRSQATELCDLHAPAQTPLHWRLR